MGSDSRGLTRGVNRRPPRRGFPDARPDQEHQRAAAATPAAPSSPREMPSSASLLMNETSSHFAASLLNLLTTVRRTEGPDKEGILGWPIIAGEMFGPTTRTREPSPSLERFPFALCMAKEDRPAASRSPLERSPPSQAPLKTAGSFSAVSSTRRHKEIFGNVHHSGRSGRRQLARIGTSSRRVSSTSSFAQFAAPFPTHEPRSGMALDGRHRPLGYSRIYGFRICGFSSSHECMR